MKKFLGFLNKVNPANFLPPLIRAYKQEQSGQQLSQAQKNYLKWGSIGLIFIFSLLWFIFYYPYFRHQGYSNLFVYTPDFALPFLNGGYTGGVSEFLWRWVAQFYLNVPLIILTVALIVVGFCLTGSRVAGPYTPFLLPFFFLLFPSPRPERAAVAVSLWLNMLALAVYISMARGVARRAGGVGANIFLHLFGAAAAVFLFYAAGQWALMFCVTAVFFHLLGLSLSLSDQKEGLLRLRFINLLITIVVMLVVSILFWNLTPHVPFRAEWYVWTALGIYAVAMVPGLLLQCYNNRKIYIYQWKKRKGEMPDGKPALASMHNVFLTLIAIVAGFVLFLFSQDREIHTRMRAENAIEKANYSKSLRICARYLCTDEYADKKARKHHADVEQRIKADYKLSLLMEGRINREENPLVQELFPAPQKPLLHNSYSYLAVCRALKMPEETLSLVLSDIEMYGLQNRYLGPLLGSSLDAREYGIFRNALYTAGRTLGNQSKYYYYRGLSQHLLLNYQHDSVLVLQPENPAALQKEGFIDKWVTDNFEKQVFGGEVVCENSKLYIDITTDQGKKIRRRLTPHMELQKPANVAILEYYTFLCLTGGEEKGTQLVPYLKNIYTNVGFEALPARLNEQ